MRLCSVTHRWRHRALGWRRGSRSCGCTWHPAQDVLERAAELIHEHYSAGTKRDKPSTRPWKYLDTFIRQSNRRQVLNALWIVETLGNHTWNSLEQTGPTESLPA